MDFGLTEDQVALQRYVREVLAKRSPIEFVREMSAHGTAYDRDLYAELADLGWMGVAVPERWGGQGLTYVDLAVLIEESGRALLPGPFFATVGLAIPTILGGGREEQLERWVPALARGEQTATVAYTEPSGFVGPSGVTARAEARGDAFVLTGIKSYVLDAHVADQLVIAARTASSDGDPARGITLFVVPRDAAGVGIMQQSSLDRTRRLGTITLTDVVVPAADVLGPVDGGWPILAGGLQRTVTLLAAESIGAAQKVLESTVEFAKTRVQFGRPIGSFQAVKHRLADMLMDVELGRTAEYYAAWAASEAALELPLAAAMAKAVSSETFTRGAEYAIQTHGGIGYTWEHELHLYLRRARTSEALFGNPSRHRAAVATLIAA